MHIELDGFGLLLVLEVVVSQQVVDLINDGGRRCTTLRKAWSLKDNKKHHFFSSCIQTAAQLKLSGRLNGQVWLNRKTAW